MGPRPGGDLHIDALETRGLLRGNLIIEIGFHPAIERRVARVVAHKNCLNVLKPGQPEHLGIGFLAMRDIESGCEGMPSVKARVVRLCERLRFAPGKGSRGPRRVWRGTYPPAGPSAMIPSAVRGPIPDTSMSLVKSSRS